MIITAKLGEKDIKLGVAEHYVGVLRAESAVAVAGSYVASLRTHTENARNRYEFGDVPQNDYLAASVTLADANPRSAPGIDPRFLSADDDLVRTLKGARLVHRILDAPAFERVAGALRPLLTIPSADAVALIVRGLDRLETSCDEVIMLFDEVLGHVNEKVTLPTTVRVVERERPPAGAEEFLPYAITETDVQPMASVG